MMRIIQPGRWLQPSQGTQPCLLDRRKMHRRFAHLARHHRATQPETTEPAESNMTWHRSGISMPEAWKRHWHPSSPSIGTIPGSEYAPRHEHQHPSASASAWASASAFAAHGMAAACPCTFACGLGLSHTARQLLPWESLPSARPRIRLGAPEQCSRSTYSHGKGSSSGIEMQCTTYLCK